MIGASLPDLIRNLARACYELDLNTEWPVRQWTLSASLFALAFEVTGIRDYGSGFGHSRWVHNRL